MKTGAARSTRRRRAPTLPAGTAPKLRGEIGEALFQAKALRLGFVVGKPFGDSARYDFFLDFHGRISRVQVKSAWKSWGGGYQVVCATEDHGLRAYRNSEIDFLAVYIAPEEGWFIIPVGVVSGIRSLHLRGAGGKSRYGRYREAWELMQ